MSTSNRDALVLMLRAIVDGWIAQAALEKDRDKATELFTLISKTRAFLRDEFGD